MARDAITLVDVREPHIVNKLRLLRVPGESYSDVILRWRLERPGARPIKLDRLNRSPAGAWGCQETISAFMSSCH
jgi:hypothetical protein